MCFRCVKYVFQMSCPTWESELAKLAGSFDSKSEHLDSGLQVCSMFLLDLSLFCCLLLIWKCSSIHCRIFENVLQYSSISDESDVWLNRAQPRQLSGEINIDLSASSQLYKFCLISALQVLSDLNFTSQVGLGGVGGAGGGGWRELCTRLLCWAAHCAAVHSAHCTLHTAHPAKHTPDY